MHKMINYQAFLKELAYLVGFPQQQSHLVQVLSNPTDRGSLPCHPFPFWRRHLSTTLTSLIQTLLRFQQLFLKQLKNTRLAGHQSGINLQFRRLWKWIEKENSPLSYGHILIIFCKNMYGNPSFIYQKVSALLFGNGDFFFIPMKKNCLFLAVMHNQAKNDWSILKIQTHKILHENSDKILTKTIKLLPSSVILLQTLLSLADITIIHTN